LEPNTCVEPPAAAPFDTGYPGRWKVLTVLCIGLFMLLLDGTIVNIALPSILQSFATGFSEVEWVINAYLLVFAVLLITMGRLGDMFGRRRLFVTGITLFTLASLACGMAPGIGLLISFRALQGLGGSMMMPATLSIIAHVFPSHQRGVAMGIWGGTVGIATAAGPTLGGLIVDNISFAGLFNGQSWPYIFLINVPIGILVFVLTLRVIPESRDATSSHRLDLPGVVVLSAALFCLTFALIEGQNYGWTSVNILALFAAAVVGIAAFILVERRQPEPLMQLSLFRSRNFSVANACGAALSGGMMGIFFLLPLFFQAIMGYSAVKTGLLLTPMSAAVVVASPLSGWLSDRIGSRWLIAGGMAVAAIGFLLVRPHLVLNGGVGPLILPFVISGLGIGVVSAPMTSAVMASAPITKAGAASGVLSTMRQLGSVMGIAIMGAVLQNRVVLYAQEAVAEKLAPISFIPAGARQRIVDAVGGMAGKLGEMRTDGGMSGAMPPEVKSMLSQAPQQAVDYMKNLFSADFFMGEFARAMRTTMVVAVLILAVGALLALLISNHVQQRTAGMEEAREGGPAREAGLCLAEGAEPLAEGELLVAEAEEEAGTLEAEAAAPSRES